MPPRHVPRTRHFNDDGSPRYTNRLAGQTSPYLLQHLHNPVEWWPWGEAAFEEARRRDVPVFLSVGYATCHWCHVMEEESFEDEDIAAVMSANYVCIKLDREERPDVDAVYMSAVQAMTGQGGWPMSVFLTPDTRRPFFAGTYFPARDGDRGTRVGFRTILTRLAEGWRGDRGAIVKSADAVADELQAIMAAPAPGDAPGLTISDDLVAGCAARFDAKHGGVGRAPKFPSQTPLRALFRHSARTGRTEGKDMALLTLRRMITGGIFDQVGGGFHRYSVDDRWLVPHFEKMLYDNALLVPALLDAFQLTGDAAFADAARATLSFIDTELGSPDGCFWSATDADSPTPGGAREEGFFFTWTPDELALELGVAGFSDDDIRAVAVAWDVTVAGNFEGRSIPWHKESLATVGKRLGRDPADVIAILDRARAILRVVRRERPAPLTDTKVIAAWNGLAISAFALAGFVLDDAALVARATQALTALLARAQQSDGRLWRVRDPAHEAGAAGTLEDHAFVCRAALDVYEATGDLQHLRTAQTLDGVLQRHFEDGDHGGFFVSADDGEVLLAREKPDRDGAEPSGNSVQAENLFRLALMTDDDSYRLRGDRTVRAFSQLLRKHPSALSEMTTAIELDEASREIVVGLPDGDVIDDDGRQLLQVLRQRFIPSRVLVWQRGDDHALQEALPLTRGRQSTGAVTIFVCEGGACRLPVTTSRGLLEALGDRPA